MYRVCWVRCGQYLVTGVYSLLRAVQTSRIDRDVILQRSYSVIAIYRKSPNPITVIPANTRHLYNICTMLAQRRRCHTNHGFTKKYIQYLQNIFLTKYRRSYTPSALATRYHKHIHAIFIKAFCLNYGDQRVFLT